LDHQRPDRSRHIGSPQFATANKGEGLFDIFTGDVVALLERVIQWMATPGTDEPAAATPGIVEMVGLRPPSPSFRHQLHGSPDPGQRLGPNQQRIWAEPGAIRQPGIRLWPGLRGGIGFFGAIIDYLPLRWSYPCVLLLWSAAGFATGLVTDYKGLLICRTALGFLEAGHWPCAVKVTQRLLEPKDRSMGNSLLQSGTSIGAIATPLIMQAILTPAVGSWRPAFQIVGAAGVLWVAVWFFLIRGESWTKVQSRLTRKLSPLHAALHSFPVAHPQAPGRLCRHCPDQYRLAIASPPGSRNSCSRDVATAKAKCFGSTPFFMSLPMSAALAAGALTLWLHGKKAIP
jgi:hypothetical protein